jgi:hypothetical protein
MDMARNIEPPDFKEQLQLLVELGRLPEKDFANRPIDYRYEVFEAKAPRHFFIGLSDLQYNVLKGLFCGVVFALSSPIKGAIEGYNNRYENKSVEGGVLGFGQGLIGGLTGGGILTVAGVVHGVRQFVRGVVSVDNMRSFLHAIEEVEKDFQRLSIDPVLDLVVIEGDNVQDFDYVKQEQIIFEVMSQLALDDPPSKYYDVEEKAKYSNLPIENGTSKFDAIADITDEHEATTDVDSNAEITPKQENLMTTLKNRLKSSDSRMSYEELDEALT